MYAIVETQGKQHKVTEGKILIVDRLEAEEGSTVDLNHVMLLGSDDSVRVGAPFVDGASVTAKVLEHKKGKKVLVFKKKRRKQYKRLKGHRQALTVLKIEGIKG